MATVCSGIYLSSANLPVVLLPEQTGDSSSGLSTDLPLGVQATARPVPKCDLCVLPPNPPPTTYLPSHPSALSGVASR